MSSPATKPTLSAHFALVVCVAAATGLNGCHSVGRLQTAEKFVDPAPWESPAEMQVVMPVEPPFTQAHPASPSGAENSITLATFAGGPDTPIRFELAARQAATDSLLTDTLSATGVTPISCPSTADCCRTHINGSRSGECWQAGCYGRCPPYRHRCPPYNFKQDVRAFLPLLRDDAHALANWNNVAFLGTAAAAAIALRQGADDQVREDTASNPKRWGSGSEFLGRLGDAKYQVPVLLALYGYTLHHDDAELHHFTSSLFSAYTLTGLSTVAIKGIVNSDRPSDDWNDGQFGFPSFHTSSSFAIAAVIDEYHGPRVGVPAYVLAGLISWSRIDERDHDLSDVVFGAALGYVIGKAVSGRHLYGDSRVRILPFMHPTEGSAGLMLECPF